MYHVSVEPPFHEASCMVWVFGGIFIHSFIHILAYEKPNLPRGMVEPFPLSVPNTGCTQSRITLTKKSTILLVLLVLQRQPQKRYQWRVNNHAIVPFWLFLSPWHPLLVGEVLDDNEPRRNTIQMTIQRHLLQRVAFLRQRQQINSINRHGSQVRHGSRIKVSHNHSHSYIHFLPQWWEINVASNQQNDSDHQDL